MQAKSERAHVSVVETLQRKQAPRQVPVTQCWLRNWQCDSRLKLFLRRYYSGSRTCRCSSMHALPL